MNTPARVTAFVVGLAAVFAAALGVGALAGPFDEPSGHSQHAQHAAGEQVPGGRSDTAEGYRLTLRNPGLAAGPARPIVVTVTGPDGRPVTDYDVTHDKELHLVAARHDFTAFRHVHPTRASDGSWSAPVDITPGRWRIYADFAPAGHQPVVLGADLNVTGDPVATVTPTVSRTSMVDGYTVMLTGDLSAGAHSSLGFAVTKDGRRVTDLQPYLGAAGHLVALREDDRSYLHVHPDEDALRFGVEVPAADRYHLFLDFKHDGVVRTAQFALDATDDHHPSAEHHHD